MRSTWTWIIAAWIAALVGATTVSLAAQSMPRLVDELKIMRGADSPGDVVFNHSTHVDSDNPECTSCHPRDFAILKADRGKNRIVHENFEKRRQCGRCHNGERAFAIEADCTNCHRG
jgi:c(7)-type cytochrome triheme protein